MEYAKEKKTGFYDGKLAVDFLCLFFGMASQVRSFPFHVDYSFSVTCRSKK
jgi:hypothetical protein